MEKTEHSFPFFWHNIALELMTSIEFVLGGRMKMHRMSKLSTIIKKYGGLK